MKRFWKWLRNPTPETTLVNYIRRRRRQNKKEAIRLEAYDSFKRKQRQDEDEAIRLEAYYLWEADGKPEGRSDYYYHKAMEKRWRLGRRVMAPFFWLEKKAIEPISGWMNRADLFNILEKVGILIAVFVFLVEYGERREKAIYEAWTVIKTGQEEQSGVVALALERLNREKFNLEGIDVRKTNLFKINLKRADLERANLEEADLLLANLEGADLKRANLKGAYLGGANLKRADLSADLEGAYLGGANLKRADLEGANLEGADLKGANLEGADLSSANLEGADLLSANLERADLLLANLKGANLKDANLEAVKFCKTTMPDGIVRTYEPDCPSWVEMD